MAAVLAFSKGRAADNALLQVCRQFAAVSLASGVRVRWRWIPSEFNRADSPSRRFMTYADVADEARLDQLRARAASKEAFAAGGHGGGCGPRGPPPHEADSAPAAAPRRSLRDGKSPAGPSHGRCGDAPPGAADRASSCPDAGPRCTGVEAVAPGAPGTSRSARDCSVGASAPRGEAAG
eukprot:1479270-Pyramimonas_sp.AAC.1